MCLFIIRRVATFHLHLFTVCVCVCVCLLKRNEMKNSKHIKKVYDVHNFPWFLYYLHTQTYFYNRSTTWWNNNRVHSVEWWCTKKNSMQSNIFWAMQFFFICIISHYYCYYASLGRFDFVVVAVVSEAGRCEFYATVRIFFFRYMQIHTTGNDQVTLMKKVHETLNGCCRASRKQTKENMKIFY